MGVSFLPETEARAFRIRADFLARPEEEGGARSLSLSIPPATRNALEISLPSGARLVEAPGIADESGAFHFSATAAFTIRYAGEGASAPISIPDLDTLARIEVQGGRVLIHTLFVPMRTLPETLTLRLPEGARYVSTTLRPAQLKAEEGGAYSLAVDPDAKAPFSFEAALDRPAGEDAPLSFVLPAIDGNQGQQGRFFVVEPDDGQVRVAGDNLVQRIPAARLNQALAPFLEETPHFMSMPPGAPLTLEMTRFQAQEAAAAVLEAQSLFASFDETGRSLSILVLELPPETGPRLILPPIPGAEFWSLTVNGVHKPVYTAEDGGWIVPLESGKTSRIALAFLRKGPSLGLKGAVSVVVPETGLAAQSLRVGLVLPERVELQSIEGPVTSASGEGWPLPDEFTGAPYFFSQAFYKGEGLTISVAYKEPVDMSR